MRRFNLTMDHGVPGYVDAYATLDEDPDGELAYVDEIQEALAEAKREGFREGMLHSRRHHYNEALYDASTAVALTSICGFVRGDEYTNRIFDTIREVLETYRRTDDD